MNKINNISPYIRVALNHRGRVTLNERIIYDYELLYLQRGNILAMIDGEKHYVSTGQIMLLKPGITHSFRTMGTEECWMPHIHFDLFHFDDSEEVQVNFKAREECTAEELNLIREDVLSKEPFNFPNIIDIPNNKEVLKVLLQLINVYEKRLPDDSFLKKSLSLKLIYMIQQGFKGSRENNLYLRDEDIEKAAVYIRENYNTKIAIKTLAKISVISIYHFERLFKLKYGVSPIEYQIRYRIEKAKEMMLYSQISLTEIATKVGYSNINSFSKVFKNKMGISPNNYRKMNK